MTDRGRAVRALRGALVLWGVLGVGAAPCRAVSDMEGPPLPPPLEARQTAIETVFDEFPELKPDVVFGFMKENFPDWVQEFNETVLRNARQGVEELGEIVRQYLELKEMEKQNPEIYLRILEHRKLETQSRKLARRLMQQEQDGRESILQELKSVLDRSFQVKQDLMQREVESMAEDLEQIRSLIRKRQENKDSLIQRRLDELTEEEETLEW